MVSQTQKNGTLLFLRLRDFWKLTMDYLVAKCKPSRNDKLNRLKTICVWFWKVGFETIFTTTWSEGEPSLRSVKAGLRHNNAGTSDTQKPTRSECKTGDDWISQNMSSSMILSVMKSKKLMIVVDMWEQDIHNEEYVTTHTASCHKLRDYGRDLHPNCLTNRSSKLSWTNNRMKTWL